MQQTSLVQALNDAAMKYTMARYHQSPPQKVHEMPMTQSPTGSVATMVKADPSKPGGKTTKKCH